MTPPVSEPVYVGRSVPRRDGAAKVTGRARYIDDLPREGQWIGATVRSSVAAGRIRSVTFEPGVPWDEIVVVDHRDVPRNVIDLIESDQPVLAAEEVRHKEEPVLLLAHPDAGVVAEAVARVRIEYDASPPVLDMEQGAVQKEFLIESGDIDAAFRDSDLLFERTYRTGAQEHVYIETNGFIASWEGPRLILQGSLQCPYYVQKAVCGALQIPPEQVDVQQECTGGGFGGKEEFPSVLAIHAALLARKAGHAVRLIYDRHEDLAASTKRHPSLSRLRVGCTSDGILKVLDFDFHLDGGAYITLSPVVLSRGVLHGCGPYRWPAARLRARSWFTNSPPYGAFRGFGAPQSLFAIETHLTLLAEHLGIDPAELRRRNFLRAGDALPTGQVIERDPRLPEMLDRALELTDYAAKRAHYGRGGHRGIGVSAALHGNGFTGSGEVYLSSRVHVATCADGGAEIRVASTDIGQGTETIFPQIVADALGIPLEQVRFHQPRTNRVPNSGPTVASRTCAIVGNLVREAAGQLRERLGSESIADHFARHGETVAEAQFRPRPGLAWDEKSYKGSAYGSYSYMITVAEVETDAVTADARVTNLTATVDIGTVINPTLACGQVEGGMAQAAGWATIERVVLHEGAMANAQMTNYIIPTAADAPAMHVEFFPQPDEYGAFGAKGVGEMPMDGPAPAIACAIGQALGREVTSIPARPEELL